MSLSRRTFTLAGIAGGVVIAAGLGVAVATGGTETAAATTSESVSTVAVVKRDLVTRDDVSGTLGYADPVVISAGAAGVVTKLPAAGSVVVRGKALAEVNARAVRLLYGTTPMWRRLEKGIDDGVDVAQLERNLLELGYDPSGMEVDDHFDGATANAVKAWQEALGVAETGFVEPGDVVFLSGARRIGQLSASVGTSVQPGQSLLTTTSTTPVVDVDLTATDQELAEVGAKVSVELPSGRIVAGTITELGRVAETATDAQGQTGEATVSVTVTLDDPATRDALDGAPVIVSLERSRAKSVLAVPVEALLALQGGGSALEQVAADGTRSLVAVQTGRFADGFVEVEGKGVRKGLNVVVPS
jgi:peptidoglycan hydrolase-like protein with peptidoglycan-binding domain